MLDFQVKFPDGSDWQDVSETYPNPEPIIAQMKNKGEQFCTAFADYRAKTEALSMAAFNDLLFG